MNETTSSAEFNNENVIIITKKRNLNDPEFVQELVDEVLNVEYDTDGDGKWWRFVNGEPDRPLSDDEAAWVIWHE